MSKKRKFVKHPYFEGVEKIYGWEPYFEKLVWVATVDHENKEVRPTQGYFPPHQHGITSKRYAKKMGYNFNAA